MLTLHELSPDGMRVLDAGEVVIDGDRLPGTSTLEGPKLERRDGWYRVLAPAGGVATGWQLAFRSRIKVFFRPPNLPYGVEAAPDKLQWCRVPTAQGLVLEVFNPTPYHVTFERIEVHAPGQRHVREPAASGAENMVIPGGRRRFTLPGAKTSLGAAATVEFQTLDDVGMKNRHRANVCPG